MRSHLLILICCIIPLSTWALSPVDNLSSFGPNLYRSARPNDDALKKLGSIGIKTVIDLQGGDLNNEDYRWLVKRMEPGESNEWIQHEKTLVEKQNIRFINIPLDSLDPISAEDGYKIGEILKILANPENGPVLLHCEHGKDRTGLIVALYRVFYEHWTPQDAHEEMEAMGHGPLNQLVTYNLDNFFWAATQGK